MFGINVDPTNPSGCPDPARLQGLGFTWVRLVSRPAAEAYAALCQAVGLKVLAVVARESYEYVMEHADAIQVGNEMDQIGESSYTMTPEDFAFLWWSCFWKTGNRPMILGGLTSGIPSRLSDYLPKAPGCSGVAVHPYGKDPEQVRSLLREYKALAGGLPLWLTEWNRPADQMKAFTNMCREEGVEVAIWFCWSDGMVAGFGLEGKEQAMKEAIHMAEFVLGFKAKAEELGPEIVGEPLEDEDYFPTGNHSIQTTTKGFMFYSKKGNKVGFVPFKEKS